MNAPHIHLLINHLPIIGLIIGILVVICGLFSKKQLISSVGLWITMIAGFSSYPTMYSGGASEHFLEENEGKYCLSEELIHEHEEAAELAFWPCIATGIFAGLALIGNKKGHKHTKKAEILVVFVGIIAIILIGKAGLTGGQIRHPEISSCCSAEGSGESCKGMSGHGGCTYMNSEKCGPNCMPGCKHNGTDPCCKTDSISQKQNSQALNGKSKLIFFGIPPGSGYGTGVCSTTLEIDRNMNTLKATETCGGHDENGHTESTSELFTVSYKTNFKYKVASLTKTGSIDCAYFEFKDDKLYLYDENSRLIHDWFCTEGNTPNRIQSADACDCIFLPYEE